MGEVYQQLEPADENRASSTEANDANGGGKTRRVFIYTDRLPRETGSGADIRMNSNAQAFIDLGFDVTFVLISKAPPATNLPANLNRARVDHCSAGDDDGGMLGRVAYRLGIPTAASFRYYFALHRATRDVALEHHRRHPDAVHFFEGEGMASAVPFVPIRRAIWSLHDLPATVTSAIVRIACELDGRTPTSAERRQIRFTSRAERWIAGRTPLILAISDADRIRLQSEWGIAQVETLPTFIRTQPLGPRDRPWMDGGRLNLLHLGNTRHLPSFRSLEFLFERVLPALPPAVQGRIHLSVVGSHDLDDPRSRRIRELAARFPRCVTLLGYVDDIRDAYRTADLQVVATTDGSGLRTRIVESFAMGVPVLSTAIGAAGMLGLRDGRNIMIADTPEEFVQTLFRLVADPGSLDGLAEQARKTYEENYSRRVVSARLADYLRAHFGNTAIPAA
jgi:glycosyltransferase involved in cell wall biosynthesis